MSAFKPADYNEALTHRQNRPQKPHKPLACKSGGLSRVAKERKNVPSVSQTQKKPIRAVGRRGREWRRVWAWLKPRLEKAQRTECEFDFIPHNCFGPLDPAHSKKRNRMRGNDIYAVAIACRNIHKVLDEVYTHAAMEKAVMTAIERGGGLILP